MHPRQSTARDAARIAYYRSAADQADEGALRVRHAAGWVLAALFAGVMFATVYLAPLGVLALAVTWLGHRDRHRRRAAAARAVRPRIDPLAEIEFARQYGLPTKPWVDSVMNDIV